MCYPERHSVTTFKALYYHAFDVLPCQAFCGTGPNVLKVDKDQFLHNAKHNGTYAPALMNRRRTSRRIWHFGGDVAHLRSNGIELASML